jgi:hypothetical protein
MKKRVLNIIAILLGALAMISCIISIIRNDIYQDGAWANAQWLGQDMVTLFLAVPLLFLSYFKGIQGHGKKWELVFTGVLLYYAYTYAFYMFAARLSFLYLFHLPIFGLSVIGLVISLIRLFETRPDYANKHAHIKGLAIVYLLLISLLLTFLWTQDILSHLFDPEHQSDTPDGNPPLIIYSLDLALIIPLMIASALLLMRKKNPGFILGGIMLVKTSVLGFALMAMALSMYFHELSPDLFLAVLWCVIGLLGTVLTIFYFRSLQTEKSIPLSNP